MSTYGSLPKGWNEVELMSLSSVITDGAHSSPKPQTQGRFMCSVKDMTYNKFDFSNVKLISEEDYQLLVKQGCAPQKGDLLISKDGANCLDLLFLYEQEEEIVLLSSIAIVRLKDTVCKEYVRYFLLSPDCQFIMRNNYVSGSAIPRVVLKDFKKVPIVLPPLSEQKAIASVLSSLDDKIDLLHRQNKTLETMAETLFRQWFIEEAKEEWEEIAFGELIELHDSKRIPLSQLQRDEKRVGQLYPYYGASGVIDYINAYIFKGDYLLLSEDGENLRTRKTPIAFEANGKFWVNNHAHVMQAKLPYTNGLLRILLEGENLDSIITGAVQPKINQANLIGYKIPNFPHDLVQQYVTVSDPWFKKVFSNKQQIQTLENLRDTLLPKLMSGEVRVQYQTEEVA